MNLQYGALYSWQQEDVIKDIFIFLLKCTSWFQMCMVTQDLQEWKEKDNADAGKLETSEQ